MKDLLKTPTTYEAVLAQHYDREDANKGVIPNPDLSNLPNCGMDSPLANNIKNRGES